MEWVIASIALFTAYLLGRLVAASFKRSRCCRAKVRYQLLTWGYDRAGDVCAKCGMLQD